MRLPVPLVIATALALAGCGRGPDATAVHAQPQRIAAHVGFLAHDLLEGRDAGSRGYDIAAQYVASQFAALGLQPAGDHGGWLQEVALLRGQRVREGASLRVDTPGAALEFAFEQDFVPGVDFNREQSQLTAPLVFVGQGVVAPEFQHDDFAGVDLHGKIAVLFNGAPAAFPNDARAYHSSRRQKYEQLVAHGAAGALFLSDPEREARSPWARGAANWALPGMRLLDAAGAPVDSFPQLQAEASLSADAARRLLDASGHPAEAIFQQLRDGKLAAFELGVQASLGARSRLERTRSSNVVARLPGSEPAGDREHIVYTAHLDHVGIGAAVNGDSIYNGALDNALGVGLLLETARLAALGPAVPRSRVFVALTAEEKGLLGAEHFAAQPGLDGTLVANINMDMPVILGARDDVLPIGIEHSSLQAVVQDSAAELGVKLSADPLPEEVVFVRSDQYAFIRRGIPAVYLDGGIHSTTPGVDGRDQLDDFLRNHYHQPSDQVDLPIHYPTAARLADLNHAIGLRIARDPQRPRWNPGDFFGERFAGPAARAP